MYIDESGDHAYKRLDSPWHKYLALLGVWFEQQSAYLDFTDQLTRLKRDVFQASPDDPLILHRSEIKGRKGDFGVLNDPAVDQKFQTYLLELVTVARFTMVCTIIDKKSHVHRYGNPYPPYDYAMTALLERYAFWLSNNGARGDAMAEGRGKREDTELGAAFRKVATSGTRYLKTVTAKSVFTSTKLKIRKKEHDIPGLQLADILAHPVKRAALIEAQHCEAGGDFAEELAAAARPKFRGYYGNGQLRSGYGLVWL